MRDYTRKAKIKDSNEWVIGYHVYVDYLDKHYILVSEKMHEGFSGMLAMKQYEVDGDTICNPTGLTDKKGNMIWENDIVSHEDLTHGRYITRKQPMKNSYIKWDNKEASFVRSDGISLYKENERYEVIGNTFDNPDLLKGE